jgi:hypothetical protein
MIYASVAFTSITRDMTKLACLLYIYYLSIHKLRLFSRQILKWTSNIRHVFTIYSKLSFQSLIFVLACSVQFKSNSQNIITWENYNGYFSINKLLWKVYCTAIYQRFRRKTSDTCDLFIFNVVLHLFFSLFSV